LTLQQFKVIQGHRPWCQWKAHGEMACDASSTGKMYLLSRFVLGTDKLDQYTNDPQDRLLQNFVVSSVVLVSSSGS